MKRPAKWSDLVGATIKVAVDLDGPDQEFARLTLEDGREYLVSASEAAGWGCVILERDR